MSAIMGSLYTKLNITNTICAIATLLSFVISLIDPYIEVEIFKYRLVVILLVCAIVYSIVAIFLHSNRGGNYQKALLLGKQVGYLVMIHIPISVYTLIAYGLSNIPSP